jgi:hypothetical protein
MDYAQKALGAANQEMKFNGKAIKEGVAFLRLWPVFK